MTEGIPKLTRSELATMPALAGFKRLYARELARELNANPEEYCWPASEIPAVVDRMVTAIYHGRANNSNVLRRCSKRMGLTGSMKELVKFVQLAVQAEQEATKRNA